MTIALCDTPKGLLLSLRQTLRRLRNFVKPTYRRRDHINLIIRELPPVMSKGSDGTRLDRPMSHHHTIRQAVICCVLKDRKGVGNRQHAPAAYACCRESPGNRRVAQGIGALGITL